MIEDTLTSGYAYALGLESERRRLERLILAASAPADNGRGVDLSRLADEFWRADAALRELRETLERLKRLERTRRAAERNGHG